MSALLFLHPSLDVRALALLDFLDDDFAVVEKVVSGFADVGGKQVEQLGHWNRKPQWRHKVSGA